jgi:hypothetical protein
MLIKGILESGLKKFMVPEYSGFIRYPKDFREFTNAFSTAIWDYAKSLTPSMTVPEGAANIFLRKFAGKLKELERFDAPVWEKLARLAKALNNLTSDMSNYIVGFASVPAYWIPDTAFSRLMTLQEENAPAVEFAYALTDKIHEGFLTGKSTHIATGLVVPWM